MQRKLGRNARIVRPQFLAEIEPLLDVRLARCQLAANRKEATPGAPAARHGDLHLLSLRQREEAPAGRIDLLQRVRRNRVPRRVEETQRPARRPDLACCLRARGGVLPKQGRHIDDGQLIAHGHTLCPADPSLKQSPLSTHPEILTGRPRRSHPASDGRSWSPQETHTFNDLPPENRPRQHPCARPRPHIQPRLQRQAAPVAQLDRAPDYEFGGQEFESLRARQLGFRTRRKR